MLFNWAYNFFSESATTAEMHIESISFSLHLRLYLTFNYVHVSLTLITAAFADDVTVEHLIY